MSKQDCIVRPTDTTKHIDRNRPKADGWHMTRWANTVYNALLDGKLLHTIAGIYDRNRRAISGVTVRALLRASNVCRNFCSGLALTFRKVGEFIEVSGVFEPGDTIRFRDFVNGLSRADGLDEMSVSLSSPGGNLAEGILFGQFIRQVGLPTIVKSSNQCHSACAIAFLGGTARGVAASSIARTLQFGAKLGFHGFSAPETSKVVLYASEMSGVDLALLSELISVDPTNIRTVTTARELRGLSIDVTGSLPPRASHLGAECLYSGGRSSSANPRHAAVGPHLVE